MVLDALPRSYMISGTSFCLTWDSLEFVEISLQLGAELRIIWVDLVKTCLDFNSMVVEAKRLQGVDDVESQ